MPSARSDCWTLRALTQYNPHGVFIALEEAGYLLMAVAFLFAGAFIMLSGIYGYDVEYRFEVLTISVDYAVVAGAGTLLAVLYRAG